MEVFSGLKDTVASLRVSSLYLRSSIAYCTITDRAISYRVSTQQLLLEDPGSMLHTGDSKSYVSKQAKEIKQAQSVA